MINDKYPAEVLNENDDDGTMPANVDELRDQVVGHKIVSVEQGKGTSYWGGYSDSAALVITLDNGKQVTLSDTSDCCAYTALDTFLLHAEKVDHVITGVGTTGEYTTWHIYADMGDVLEIQLGWSSGNPFYYGYGFQIAVRDVEDSGNQHESNP